MHALCLFAKTEDFLEQILINILKTSRYIFKWI